MGRKLYVGNLPFSAGEAELQELFATAGAVDTVKVMRDMATGRARGFAFVEMASDSEAASAIKALNGTLLGERSLNVNEARPKQDGDDRSKALEQRKRPREALRMRKHRQHRY